MSENLKSINALLEIVNDFKNKNFNLLKISLLETNKIIVSMTNHLYEEKIQIEFWQEHLEILLVKYSLHSASIVKILEGIEIIDIHGKKVVLQDISSLRILIRSLIENYLTLFDLFFSSENKSEKEFRFYLYELGGLLSRQKFEATEKENITKKEKEKLRISEIEELIKKNEYFQNLSSQKQKEILKDKRAREIGWEKLITKSDIQSELFGTIWKLFSNTAHSELLGAIQLKDLLKSGNQKMNDEICTSIFTCVMLNSNLIANLETLFPSTSKVFDNIPTKLLYKIKAWSKLAKTKKQE